MGRKRILDTNFCKFTLNVSGKNKEILDQLTENYSCKYGPLINKIIETFCCMPTGVKKAIEHACLEQYNKIATELDHTSDEFHRKDLEKSLESSLDILRLINGGIYDISVSQKEISNTKKLKISDGYLIVPKDWIIINPEDAERHKYAAVLECRNSFTYGIPHFVYLTDYRSADQYTREFEKIFIEKCRQIWPKFKEIEEMNRKNQLVPDPEDPNQYLNMEAYLTSPIIGLFSIDEQGDSLTDEYPYGAMIVRS